MSNVYSTNSLSCSSCSSKTAIVSSSDESLCMIIWLSIRAAIDDISASTFSASTFISSVSSLSSSDSSSESSTFSSSPFPHMRLCALVLFPIYSTLLSPLNTSSSPTSSLFLSSSSYHLCLSSSS